MRLRDQPTRVRRWLRRRRDKLLSRNESEPAMNTESSLPEGVVRGICPLTDADERTIRSFPRYEGPGTSA
jgi:hypothetical protein